MKETLQCTQCDVKWERKKARGRKPIVCPDCATLNAEEAEGQTYSPVIKEDLPPVDYVYPSVSYWICHTCERTLSVHVGLNYIPTHNCRLKRNLPVPFQQTNRKTLKEITA